MDDAPLLGGHQPGPPTGATGPVPGSSSSSACPSACDFPCEFPGCGRIFTTNTGRGVHHRRAHKDWYDSQQNVEHVKGRWNPEESALLVHQEARLSKLGVRFINQELLKVFPGRSLESIKGQRKKVQHKKAVEQLLTTIDSDESTSDDSAGQCPSDPSNDLDDMVIDYINGLGPCASDEFNSTRLDTICSSLRRLSKARIFEEISLYLLETFPAKTSGNREHRAEVSRKAPVSRRQERRAAYGRVQKAWSRNRSTCIRALLKDKHTSAAPNKDVMIPFWERVMTSNDTSSPGVGPRRETVENLWTSILPGEIRDALPHMTTASGPDGFSARDLKSIPLSILTRIYNILVLCGKSPVHWLESRTTLIPKKDGAADPGEFRPITVSSVFLRTFHKVLANRMARLIQLDCRQKAFRPIDGCSENIFLMDFALRYTRQCFKPLFLASIDVAKAFDSVTHASVMDTLRTAGVPELMINYIADTYERSSTRLHCENWTSHSIHPTCGVKQGDPLSPIIFNLIMDRLLSKLSNVVGIRLGDITLNAACFADDLVLFATTSQGLQLLLDTSAEYLLQCGLKMNASKSFTVALKNVPKQKKSVVDAKQTFSCLGRTLPALRRSDDWKYLGVPFTPEGRLMARPWDKLKEDLNILTAAPLKPQQRLFILRTVVLPSLHHLLVLGLTNVSLLNKMDILVRSVVRKWLDLPHDVPNAYFHANVKDGGLSLFSFRWIIPLHRMNRLKILRVIEDGETPEAMKRFRDLEMKRVDQRLKDGELNISSLDDYWRRFANLLYASNDGRPLKHSRKVEHQHRWITDGSLFVSGRDFIRMNKLRVNAIPLRSRMARGRFNDRQCRAGCGHAETLQHVLQICERNHAMRIKRHDACLDFMLKRINKESSIFREPHIRTSEGLRKPDAVIKQGSSAIVVDALVAGECANLDQAHQEKIRKYEGLRDHIKEKYSVNKVTFTSMTISSRGVWSKKSFDHLQSLGLIKRTDAKILSTRVLIGGLSIINTFHSSTRSCRRRTGQG